MNKHEAAFPQSGFQQWEPMPGMSLRDYFAAKAMQGVFSNPGLSDQLGNSVALAKAAYAAADCMLAAREVSQ